MALYSIDFARELNRLRKSLGLPKPIYRHHQSDGKFYTVLFMPLEHFSDLSAFGSDEGFNNRKAANDEAALKAIKGLREYHGLEFRDVNYSELKSEMHEKEVALEAVKNMLDEREMLRQDNYELRDAYTTLEERYFAIQNLFDENLNLRRKIRQLEKELFDLKASKGDAK